MYQETNDTIAQMQEYNPIVHVFDMIGDKRRKRKVAELFGLLKPKFQGLLAVRLLQLIHGEKIRPLQTTTLQELFDKLQQIVIPFPAREKVEVTHHTLSC